MLRVHWFVRRPRQRAHRARITIDWMMSVDVDYFKQSFRFANEGTSPLYAQLAAYIRTQIQAGVLKPGDQMLTETTLCEILGVSRTTVRQSLNRLVEEGLLVRYRGKGSFIASPKMRRSMNHLYDFTDDMLSLGATPSSIVLKAEVVAHPPDAVIQALRLPPGQQATFFLDRLRCANNEPILWEQTHIPYYLCSGIELYSFENTSLYYTLSKRFSLNLYRAIETLEAVVITKEEAKGLQCKPKVAGYRIRRVSYLDSGVPFEWTTSVTRADRCFFQFDLFKDAPANKNPVEIQRHITLGNGRV
jgi:GntR family transcriptional regulator